MDLPGGAPVWRLSTEVTVIVLLSVLVGTATAAEKRPASVAKPPNKDELRAARALDVARGDPLRLRALLERMPKGADLHMHLSGAVYAETLLDEGAHDSLCVNPTRLSLAPAVGTTRSVPAEPVCAEGNVRASQVLSDQALYDSMVDTHWGVAGRSGDTSGSSERAVPRDHAHAEFSERDPVGERDRLAQCTANGGGLSAGHNRHVDGGARAATRQAAGGWPA